MATEAPTISGDSMKPDTAVENKVKETDGSKRLGGIWKDVLRIVILSVFGFLFSYAIHQFLLSWLGFIELGTVLSSVAVLLITPFGFEIILGVPFLVALYLLVSKIVKAKISLLNLLLTLIAVCVAVILLRSVQFALTVQSFEEYLENAVTDTLTQVGEVVGSEPAVFTYVESSPTYSDAGDLDSISVKFLVEFPKRGTYGISSFMASEGYPVENRDIGIFSPKMEVSCEEDGGEVEVEMVFEAQELQKYNYEGLLEVTHDVWRKDIEIQAPFGGGTDDTWPVSVVDSGMSGNSETVNERGTEEPQYIIGPFPLNRN